MPELRELANFIVNLKAEKIPNNVKKAAVACITDTISVAIGARNDKQIINMKKMLLPTVGNNGHASVWGTGEKVPLCAAIFFNSMMGHVLELDDVHTLSKTHIGTVVIPAAWGIAEQAKICGEDFLTAVICGYEAMARVGTALGVVSHRKKGWHVTGTAGTFGAAAACGKLLRLNEDQMISALGLAGSQSSGLWAFLQDGASCKVLNPARAASNGCEAAIMAQGGMTGPESILTASDGGMLAAMTDAPDIKQLIANLGSNWVVLNMDKKPYPCCRSTHCAIDAAVALLREEKIKVPEIKHILVKTYEVGKQQCGLSKGSIAPSTASQAKFSTPFTVAVALLYGGVRMEDFSAKRINDSEVIRLSRKVTVISDEKYTLAYPEHWGCRMTIETTDGQSFYKEITDALGSIQNPLTESLQVEKSKQVLQSSGYKDANTLIKDLFNIENLQTLPTI